MTAHDPPVSIFAIPHAFDDFFGKRYTVPEKYFYITLRKLIDRHNADSGWVLLFDASGPASGNRSDTFESFGLSKRTCKSARRKLKEDGLIECRWSHGRKGHRIGTEYRLVDERLAQNPKAIHRAIIGRQARGFEGVSTTRSDVVGDFVGVAGHVHNDLAN
jgi:hypothetical protein